MSERVTELRDRIVHAAAALLSSGGRDAVSTRAVCAEASVQAPAIYRHFADMNELMRAAAREIFARYVRKKRKRAPTDDPVEELRHGWDTHVAFGLAEPAAYVIMYGDPTANVDTAELHEGNAMLEALVARIADAGQLRVSVPHARRLIHAGACGATLSLLSASPDERDASLSEEMREAVLARILAKVAPRKERTVATRAVSLRAVLHEVEDVLTAGEAQLLGEWLDRLSKGSP